VKCLFDPASQSIYNFGWLVIPYSVSFKELYKLKPEGSFIAFFPCSLRNGVQNYNLFSIKPNLIFKKITRFM
ncbi:MAG: hypothetical protein WCH09_08955, partial [Bacteroidota bacterium]